jgi:ParB family transcriptional regulator, chromosome partitioning protein
MSKAEDMAQRYGATIAGVVGRRPGPEALPAAPPPPDPYAGAVKIQKFAELPIEAIDRDESQPREEFDEPDLLRLADSIRRFGQLAPIRVRPGASPGRWIVLVGERRLRACRLAGKDRVRVEFVERPMTEADVLAEQLVENVARADLKPVEEGRAYRRLMDKNGWTVEQVAETFGVEPTKIHRRLGLLDLPGDIAARVDAGEIRPTAAYEISKLQIADDQRAVAEKVLAEGLDHAGTVAEVKRVRAARSRSKGRGAKAKPRKVTSEVIRTTAGPRVTVEHKKGLTPELTAAALREAAERAEAALQGREAAA